MAMKPLMSTARREQITTAFRQWYRSLDRGERQAAVQQLGLRVDKASHVAGGRMSLTPEEMLRMFLETNNTAFCMTAAEKQRYRSNSRAGDVPEDGCWPDLVGGAGVAW